MEAAIISSPYQNKPISNGVLGMILVLVTETMFFMGLISSYIVNRAGVVDWPPVDQPRLPIGITGINTVFLLASAFTLYMVGKKYQANVNAKPWLAATLILGLLFVGIQGYEWVQMLGFGLTTSSGLYASFFYAIIGMHGFHVLIGASLLIYLWNIVLKDTTKENTIRKFNAVKLFWYFVVGIWPILYYLVYIM